ncbi:outer membrane biogenesis protein BamB [Anatilimnocola aggregata]|uniref:Outer membrane biogenesis protein BamB n=1 Tax=Anatilimnocola aggregata TaxID=2528021 RepID=A0A517Y5R4_9BACT|nr:PQQ-binding-like beta-propeller repeat protein [Anatilimnocola aggregata]QDU25550.1 outer membrane biogenesis protein BamB [Anatilimnocola aggregata]
MRKTLIFSFALTLALALVTASSGAEEWNRFRGPNGSGLSTAAGIPTTWTEKDYRFQIDLPGSGNSSPVIWQDKLFVTAADAQKLERYLLCYSTGSGGLLWQKSWPLEKEKKHAKNSYASNTPACDAERVYTIWQAKERSQLLAFDHLGQELWKYDLGRFESNHGCGTSPIVVGDVVVVNNNQEGESSFLIGVKAATGEQAWKIPRAQVKATYSTPCVFRNAQGKDEVIFSSWHEGITSVDPTTGKINWEKDVFERDQEKRAIGSPIVAGDLVLANCGFAGGKKFLVAMRPNGETAAEEYRLDRMVNHQPTTIAVGDLLFLWNDQGVVSCVHAKSGQSVWQKRVGGNYAGSPICVGKALYAMSQDGELVVLAAAEEYQELGRMKLPSGSSATPAVGSGLLWLRVEDKLLALGGAK